MLKQYITPVIASLPLFFGTLEIEKKEIEVHEYVEYVEEVKEVEEAPLIMRASFYTSKCNGCIGITKSGHDVRKTIYVNGFRVIAVDPKYIQLGSIWQVTLEDGESFKAIASDTGGDIKGDRIDILVSNKEYAFQKGRQIAYMREVK